MKKFILDLTVTENLKLHANYALLKLASQSPLPEMLPGQFAEIRVDGSPTTFLRRPISINYVDRQRNEVWFLIQLVGDGTRRLAEVANGEIINVVLPLGNGFTMPENPSDKLLLVGGGVGTAPMLYLGEQLAKSGSPPSSWEHELTKICFSWMSLQLTEKYIRLPKTEVTEKKDMSPNIPY
jgi:dihydroorotate dehydrogenase electron transfer subunit